jgi:two-component system chemotaxis sensor kinase CheA
MGDSDIVKDFLAESYENLDRMDRELVALEKDPGNRDSLASVFRTIHTIKGTCGFLGFEKLEKVAHVGENLLSKLRDGLVKLNPEITAALLSMVDAVRQMLAEIQASGQDGIQEYKELQATLSRLQAGDAAISAPAVATPAAAAPPAAVQQTEKVAAPVAAAVDAHSSARSAGAAEPPKHASVHGKIGGMLVKRGLLSSEDLAFALRMQERGDKRRLGEILVSLALTKAEQSKRRAQEKPAKVSLPSQTK